MAIVIVIFGHSFVTKLRNFAVEYGYSNLRLDKDKFRIVMHVMSGLNLRSGGGGDFSLAGHLKNGHLLSICPTNSQASQIMC